MNFENMCIKSVEYISHFVPGKKKWRAENRKHHFVGIIHAIKLTDNQL